MYVCVCVANESTVDVIRHSLRSLALGMARLGLRHPEIFRCLGQVVRRSGLWSFADSEAHAISGDVLVIHWAHLSTFQLPSNCFPTLYFVW